MSDQAQPHQAPEVEPNLADALRKLGGKKGGRVPYIQQMEAADCGAACLAHQRPRPPLGCDW